ncbi:MAG: tetratricopeptide repeat protein [Candidatus Bathyarchaeia archaeon]
MRDKKNIARLHITMGWWLWQAAGDKEKASHHHRMALEILEKEPEGVELASLYEDIGHMIWRTGESAGALAWVQKSFELALRLNASEVLTRCYNDLGVLSMKSGEFENALKYYEQGLKIALENNFIPDSLTFYNNLCTLYLGTGEFQKMFETAQKGTELAKKVGALYNFTWMGQILGGCYGFMGEMQKAISIFEDILALSKRIKYPVLISGALSSLGLCYQYLGEWDKSLQYLVEAIDVAKKVGEYQFSGSATLWLGELFIEMEDFAEAERYLKESDSIYEKGGDIDARFGGVFPALSKLYLRKGEIEKAKELIEKTYEYTTKTKNRLLLSYAGMLKAMLFREEKNWGQSIQYFEKSLQGFKSLNAQKWYVHQFAELLYEYGIMYLNRNEEGDKEKAYSLLNQALEICQKADAKKRTEKIIAKKKLLTA